VIGPAGKTLEVQIRTREMHDRAERGVAAHFAYKEGTDANDSDWLNRIIDWQSEIFDPNEFMADLKNDLEQEEVFVFTVKKPPIPPMVYSKEMIRRLQEHSLLLQQQKPAPPIVAEPVHGYKEYVQQQKDASKNTAHHLSPK
jgi:hypothetical protein